MRTPILLAAIVITLLIVFNPGMEAFRTFAEAQTKQLVTQQAGSSTLGRVLGEFGADMAGRMVQRMAERDNYLLFSIYTLDFDGAEAEENEWRFLGIAGQFIELQRPERLDAVQRELQR